MAFDEHAYDLNTPDGRAAYIAAWKVDLREKGYRVDEEIETDEKGRTTLEGLAHLTDQLAHNLSLTLRDTIDQLGGRETEAGKLVGSLWHYLVSNQSRIRNIAKAQIDLVAEQQRYAVSQALLDAAQQYASNHTMDIFISEVHADLTARAADALTVKDQQ